jgi:class 3 adenylate cyclase
VTDSDTAQPPAADLAAVLADRAGVDRAFVDKLIDGGVLTPAADGSFSEGDVRRLSLVRDLDRGGIPANLLAEALRSGALNIDFVEQPSYDRFSANETETFEELGRRTGVPIELLLAAREASGSPKPAPTDRVGAAELAVVPYLEVALENGVQVDHLERTLRVAGDGVRRVAETEADWWRSDVLGPLMRQGVAPAELGARTEQFARRIGGLSDDILLALYHGQQAHAWMRNIFDGFESLLARAGLYERLERVPAIAFIDVTGYSRLTEERGDASAADLAGRIARLVQRESGGHGGRTIKWLGDGLMVYFPDSTAAVEAALEMQDAVGREDLPPAHVGIHAGPVIFREGDYFGRTVNTAARIAGHAPAGQILVSEKVAGAVDGATGVTFDPLGAVELKGMLEPVALFAVRRVFAGA